MNYYNPYFYSIPSSMMSSPKVGLFSRLFGGNFSFGTLINGTQKTLNFVNQVIPVVKQAKPMINNAKTMFKVMNEFKKTDKPKSSLNNKIINSTNNTKKENTINLNENKNINTNIDTNEGPKFFI